MMLAGVAFGADKSELADKPKPDKTVMAQKFVSEAAQGNMMEVKLGTLAGDKAESQAVKDFGAMLVKDHGDAETKLATAAANENLTVPAELDAKHQMVVDKLSAMSGAEFDKAYMAMMVKDHREDIKKYEKAAQHIEIEAIKMYAEECLPILHKHLSQAEQTATAVGAGENHDHQAK